MSSNRRTFLKTFGAAGVALAGGCRTLPWLPRTPATIHRFARVGIELYTVRRQAAADLAGVLARIAKIGYKEVEFAGYYNRPAAEVRALLDANGLTSPSTHTAIELVESNPAKVFDDAKTIGHRWITAPSLPRGKRETADDWKRVAEQFNRVGAAVKAAGFRFAFHNHADVFKGDVGARPIDILMTGTDPALVAFQMDIFWAVNGGADPRELLARYPGRFRMLHLKDGARPPAATQTDIGAGTINFRPILAAAKDIEHYFVESDSAADSFAFAANSYKYLANIEF